ncbi:hypothetical protein N7517_010340 [Penicillium concentricum]|uniref:Uncharacterized protein n=1 Tax=Penicillium concentricum TaxID=293559 RepID=A0A9W9R8V6_9EURO|nr:uncharacterized protein N7517_010340 [Penicillium concentricum]KAJ5355731.1 hypothetical protein N7517_010340 [Penicillium concentricum]
MLLLYDDIGTTPQRVISLQSPDQTIDPDMAIQTYKRTSTVYKTARPGEEKQVKCNFIPGKQPKPGFS